jgi:hypothetical protein
MLKRLRQGLVRFMKFMSTPPIKWYLYEYGDAPDYTGPELRILAANEHTAVWSDPDALGTAMHASPTGRILMDQFRTDVPLAAYRVMVREEVQQLHIRMMHSYLHDHRITSMDLRVLDEAVTRLGLGGCLDETLERNPWLHDPKYTIVENYTKETGHVIR